jgi:inner membrane protein
MDSITQVLLGSSCAVAVMGHRVSVKKVAAWGAVCGTIPDLDIFINYGDPLINMVQHRGFSHSVFYLSLMGIVFGLLATYVHQTPQLRQRWIMALGLAFVTHPLLDAMTVYGTRFGIPFSNHPFEVGNVFVIDPIYTLCLLIGLWFAWVDESAYRRLLPTDAQRAALKQKLGLRANRLGLFLASLYLLWGFLAQTYVLNVVEKNLKHQGIGYSRIMVAATPFNTLLWRVVAVNDQNPNESFYVEGFYGLLDRDDQPMMFRKFDRGGHLIQANIDHPLRKRLDEFSLGFYKMEQVGNRLHLVDLRMGVEGFYDAFRFDLGQIDPVSKQADPNRVSVHVSAYQDKDKMTFFRWLWQRIWR